MEKFRYTTDEELIKEVYSRELEYDIHVDVKKKIQDMEEELDKSYKHNNHVLPKEFDRFQLRDHLCNITRLGSYVSDKKLFDTLSDLLEFS